MTDRMATEQPTTREKSAYLVMNHCYTFPGIDEHKNFLY